MPTYLETRRKFLQNRGAIPVEELARYAGHWVAWSPAGTRVVACASSLELLDSILKANGEDPAKCVAEGLPDDDGLIGEVDGR